MAAPPENPQPAKISQVWFQWETFSDVPVNWALKKKFFFNYHPAKLLSICFLPLRAWKGKWKLRKPFLMVSMCVCVCVYVLIPQSCPTLWCQGLQSARLLGPWDFPGKNTGVGSHSLLQGIFPTQGSNPGLLHCRQIFFTIWVTREAQQSLYSLWKHESSSSAESEGVVLR